MKNYDKIDFQYRKASALNVDKFFVLGLVISIIFMIKFNKMMGIVLLSALICAINIYKYTNQKNKKGSFYFGNEDFIVESNKHQKKIKYSDVWLVVRDVWEESGSTFGIGYTTINPNEYKILLKDNSKLAFRVPKKEENSFQKKINKVNKKIYGTNSLGFGLAGRWESMPKEELNKEDKEYEKEKPKSNYSLKMAIYELIKKGNLLYEDRTELEEDDDM
ncbi:hypothetical protein [Fusobacterium sp. PH5-44]|uniref:hypothetical protein n=1 Tax=unclassified Fusobacterium TaxID=2648384 RepID=UPI003D1CBCDD